MMTFSSSSLRYFVVQMVMLLVLFQIAACGAGLPAEALEARRRQNANQHSQQQRRVVAPPGHRRWVILGTEPPVFECYEEDLNNNLKECWERVYAQQDAILNLCHEAAAKAALPPPLLHASHQRLLNLIYLDFPVSEAAEGLDEHIMADIAGPSASMIARAWPQTVATVPLANVDVNAVADALGSTDSVQQEFCVSGQGGVQVAVLDTGIDYTHALLGGDGTAQAFRNAYGTDAADERNTRRDGLFPTSTVVAGRDFLGEIDLGSAPIDSLVLKPDLDPIDAPVSLNGGHGTAVGAAVLSMAPNVQLVAVKVCLNQACLPQPILDGLEYALDPDGDGNTSDRVQVINLSLGQDYLSAYFSELALAIENAFSQGVVVVVAAGNQGNIPYVLGQVSGAYNALTVGATGIPSVDMVAADFTSRGPGDNFGAQQLKPEISAPGDSIRLAGSGLGTGLLIYSGTSFSSPLVAGAVALMVERCLVAGQCSPLFIKSILVNTADRGIKYKDDGSSALSPLSLTGSGQVNVERALRSDIWAFSVQDAQPTMSLGVVNVVDDTTTILRTLRITNLSSQAQSYSVTVAYRDSAKSAMLSVTVPSGSATVSLPGNSCGSAVTLDVSFNILASQVPLNHMTGAGEASHEPERLDIQELDGWVVLTSTTDSTQQIVVPFHSIVRRAARVTVQNNVLPARSSWPVSSFPLGMTNTGKGPAQVDTFQLVELSPDNAESNMGSEEPHADFRYIGYRATFVDNTCGYLMEFAAVWWEGHRTPTNTEFQVQFFIDDNDNNFDFILANHGPHQQDTAYNECRILNAVTDQWTCAGFAPEHATNSATTIVRACSTDLGFASSVSASNPATFRVGFASITVPRYGTVDATFLYTAQLPPTLQTASFDVQPGQSFNSIPLATTTDNGPSFNGVLMLTDTYRTPTSTGASALGSEAVALVFSGTTIPSEVTANTLQPPLATVLTDPSGCSWTTKPSSCRRRLHDKPIMPNVTLTDGEWERLSVAPIPDERRLDDTSDTCPEQNAGLLTGLLTQPPSKSPTRRPTESPTLRPSSSPTRSPAPSGRPTVSPRPSVSAAPSSRPSVSHAPTTSPAPSAQPQRTNAPNLPNPDSSGGVASRNLCWRGCALLLALALFLLEGP